MAAWLGEESWSQPGGGATAPSADTQTFRRVSASGKHFPNSFQTPQPWAWVRSVALRGTVSDILHLVGC